MVKVYLQWYRYYELKKSIESLQQQNADHSKDGEIIEKERLASELYDLYTESRDLAISTVIDEFEKKIIDSTYAYLNRLQAKAQELEKQAASSNQPENTQ
jgi:gas vesicle protein